MLPYFKGTLHTLAIKNKIKVQENVEMVCLLSRKPD